MKSLPVHLIILALLFCGRTPGEAQSGKSGRPYPFGMVSNHQVLRVPEYRRKMLDAGAHICRVEVLFDDVRRMPEEMNPDRWAWSTLETIAKNRVENPGLEYLILLGYGASWAEDIRFKTVGGRAQACPQRGVEIMPPWDSRNLYGHYVFETVRRYRRLTRYWESWNEPDLSFFKGSGKDFFHYQKACYLSAKKADPHCTVLFAGMCFPTIEGYLNKHGLARIAPHPSPVSFFEQFLAECVKDPEARKNHYYFDVMNQHSYFRASDMYDATLVVRKLMRDFLGEEKPVWITECGWAEKGGNFGGPPAEYCDYLLQSFAWATLAGVERIFHFQLDNSNRFGLYSGMLGDPKLALFTYRDVLTKEFATARLEAQRHGNPGVGYLEGNSPYQSMWRTGYDLFEFTRSDGKRLWMAFADTTTATEIRIPARKRQAVLVDRHNSRTLIQASEGFYTLELPGATNRGGWPAGSDPAEKALGKAEHLVGGATQVLIE